MLYFNRATLLVHVKVRDLLLFSGSLAVEIIELRCTVTGGHGHVLFDAFVQLGLLVRHTRRLHACD